MIEHAYPSKRYNNTDFEGQLTKVVSSVKNNIPRIGINNPKIGNEDGTWRYCVLQIGFLLSGLVNCGFATS